MGGGGVSAWAEDDMEVAVGAEVEGPQGRRRDRVAADLLARVEARPYGRRPGRDREVDDVPLAVVARHDVQELIAVHVAQRDGRRVARLGAEADRRGEPLPDIRDRSVVSVETVDLTEVGDHEVEVAVLVHVTEGDGPGVVRLGSDRGGGCESLLPAGGIC